MRRSILNLPTEWKQRAPSDLNAAYNAGWHPVYYGGAVQESYAGAWQQGVTEANRPSLLSFSAVFCCVTGIAGDIGKLRIKLTRNDDGIWQEITSGSPYLPVLRKPNHYQTRNQFVKHWILSKLLHGNAYIALERDNRGGEGRGVVRAMYVLDPCKVTPLVSENTGDVFYRVGRDPLSEVFDDDLIIPAADVIHDRMNAGMFHPLIGVSPLYACSASAYLGSKISSDSATFYGNRSFPGGIITSPTKITETQATTLKTRYEEAVGGSNIGKLLVLADGLKFEAMRMTAREAQTADQLKFAVSDVGRAFHYPEYKMGGALPPYSGNMQALTLDYYTGCLQDLI